jgi:hypothetical protein
MGSGLSGYPAIFIHDNHHELHHLAIARDTSLHSQRSLECWKTASKLPSRPTDVANSGQYTSGFPSFFLMLVARSRYSPATLQMGERIWTNLLPDNRHKNLDRPVICRKRQRTPRQTFQHILLETRPLHFPKLDFRGLSNGAH